MGNTELNLIKEAYAGGISPIYITGVTESARADVIRSVAESGKAFVVVGSMYDAKALKEDMEFYCGENVDILPSKDYIFHNIETAATQLVTERLRIIDGIYAGTAGIVIAPVDSVLEYTLPKEIFEKYRYDFRPGERVDLKSLVGNLIIMGYKNSETVEGVGQMSLRGGILDIFPPAFKNPVRIEFFDDEVDTIRFFDPETQISLEQTDLCRVGCCRELIYDDVTEIIKKISACPMTEWTGRDVTLFEQQHYFPATDRYIPLIYDKITTPLDYLSGEYTLFMDYPAQLRDRSEEVEKEISAEVMQFAENGSLPLFEGDYVKSLADAVRGLRCRIIMMSSITSAAGFITPEATFGITSKSLQSYRGRIDLIIEDIKYWQSKGYGITILAGGKTRAEAFKITLSDNGVTATLRDGKEYAENGETVILAGSLNHGFEYPLTKTVVIGCREVFGANRHRRAKNAMPGVKIKSYSDLSEGDYVVHQVHGIGQYLGMHRMEIDGISRDYLKIKYKGTDVLYVPATSLDTVNKYIGNDGREIKLSKMGGAEFAKVKNKVRKSLEDIADRLIALYAARREKKGFAFSPDTDWQKNFEEAFPYEETEDQLICIKEMKEDMESDRPMDRLLCGDVGFGKTEVALRGAFKAVMDSKQVAYLVPTTILAQQHYNTFRSRMAQYPMNVEMMSRFRTPKQLKEIARRVETGEIDVLIGTHRILQKDVKFKDLGLLIIDEEQRFGVKHKELIKEMKTDVDVLTLSATPIPRTLHMSMIGVRDMSVISQPPEDRYPVQTFVLEHDKAVIRDAVLKELGRNGQVYYVYNRVEGIYKRANELQEMAPEAKIAVAHGQMSERELETVMMDTLNGDVDILVCTTIIETGLDIPNINTIIIENADCMGLSQLYQLRGRVGRSNRLAYAYLTYKGNKALSETAMKRLTSIKEFTEFGSGFKIAMRDLEIRGAGSLLGAQQHGEMDDVGYDMYCKLLDEAVKKVKGEVLVPELITTVDIKTDTFIPDSYIASHNIRLEIYKRIAAVETEEDKENTIDELIDRFGQMPQSVINLMDISLIRVMASACGITEVTERNGRVMMVFENSPQEECIKKIISEFRGQLLYNAGTKPRLTYIASGNKQKMLSEVKAVLGGYKKIIQEKEI